MSGKSGIIFPGVLSESFKIHVTVISLSNPHDYSFVAATNLKFCFHIKLKKPTQTTISKETKCS